MHIASYILPVVLIMSATAKAGDFRSGGSVIINEPQYRDVYISAGTVEINAPVFGDVIIFGGNVIINDSVMQDILIAGGRVKINGFVGDDIRCAAGKITITNSINGDLVAAGGIIDIQNTSTIASITVTGGNVTLAGNCLGNVNAAAGEFTLTGNVGQNASIKGGKVTIKGTIRGKAVLAASEDIKVYNTARIGRGIRYWLPFNGPLNIPREVSNDKPIYDALLSITHSRWYFLGASTFLGLMWYLGMAFILIFFLQYLFASTFYRAGIRMHAKPLKSTFTGLAYFVGVPVIAILTLATIIGLPITIIISFVYVASLVMATAICSVVIVNWISFLTNREFSLLRLSGMGLFTFALLKIITFTPFLGSALMVVIAMTCFGAIISSIRWKSISTMQKTERQTGTVTA